MALSRISGASKGRFIKGHSLGLEGLWGDRETTQSPRFSCIIPLIYFQSARN